VPAGALRRGADLLHRDRMLGMGAVRKIQAENIGTGGNQLVNAIRRRTRGTHRGDNLREAMHNRDRLHANAAIRMTIESWYEWAAADAEQRGPAGLRPLVDALRNAIRDLREADWNDDAADPPHEELSGQ